jgi:excisionase family DNA binding protein
VRHDPILLKVPEAAHRLGINRAALYGLIRTRRLQSITIGRARRIPTTAITDFLADPTGETRR